ncbi:NAD-P-binding protein [Mycena galopus ATCC 62051]|nr:NAD-P-binding protein [Mycena galopus ATCC 62051]
MSKGLVLISGATGFVGTEVACQFAQAGYSVRGAARSAGKISAWKKANPEYEETVQWVIVEDGTVPGSFVAAMKGVKYVVHCGGPFHYNFKPEDNANAMLLPAINMAKAITEAAIAESSVQHMVITSSMAAVANFRDMPNAGHTYTGKEWNTSTFDEVVGSPNPVVVYCASKVLGERAIWEHPGRKFRVTSICPAMVYGPPRQAIESMDALNTSSQVVYSLVNGHSSDPVPPTGVTSGADVRDVAALHVRAVETAATVSEDRRLLAIAFHRFNCQLVASLCQSFADSPEKHQRIRNGGGDPMYEHYETDTSEAEALLGRPFIGADQCMKDTALRLWEIEKSL